MLEGPSKQRVWEDNSHLAMFKEECASNYVTLFDFMGLNSVHYTWTTRSRILVKSTN